MLPCRLGAVTAVSRPQPSTSFIGSIGLLVKGSDSRSDVTSECAHLSSHRQKHSGTLHHTASKKGATCSCKEATGIPERKLQKTPIHLPHPAQGLDVSRRHKHKNVLCKLQRSSTHEVELMPQPPVHLLFQIYFLFSFVCRQQWRTLEVTRICAELP